MVTPLQQQTATVTHNEEDYSEETDEILLQK
jgi:hypothetical protein